MEDTSKYIFDESEHHIVVDTQRLIELDYIISNRIASFLSYDGLPRKFFQVITLTGTAVVWMVGLVIAYFIAEDFQVEAYSMFMITLIMTLAVFGIKNIVKRPRPEFKDDRYLSVSFDVFSFPSGHATRSAYVTILMPIYTPELELFWYIWALIMVVSRLVLGVHYVSDIVAGLLFGFLTIGVFFLFGWLPDFPFSDLLSS